MVATSRTATERICVFGILQKIRSWREPDLPEMEESLARLACAVAARW
jgi:hypothetical protein